MLVKHNIPALCKGGNRYPIYYKYSKKTHQYRYRLVGRFGNKFGAPHNNKKWTRRKKRRGRNFLALLLWGKEKEKRRRRAIYNELGTTRCALMTAAASVCAKVKTSFHRPLVIFTIPFLDPPFFFFFSVGSPHKYDKFSRPRLSFFPVSIIATSLFFFFSIDRVESYDQLFVAGQLDCPPRVNPWNTEIFQNPSPITTELSSQWIVSLSTAHKYKKYTSKRGAKK